MFSEGQTIVYRASFQDLRDLRTFSLPVSGRFKTPPLAAQDITLAWSADTCGQGFGINPDWGGLRMYETMRRAEPDVFLHCGDTIYAAIKSALNRFTHGLAAELVDSNIAVNLVGPSTAIRTPGASDLIPSEFPTEDVEYLAETVLHMSYLPAVERTGFLGFSMHFPWAHNIQVMSLDGKTSFPKKEPPAWSHPAIPAAGI